MFHDHAAAADYFTTSAHVYYQPTNTGVPKNTFILKKISPKSLKAHIYNMGSKASPGNTCEAVFIIKTISHRKGLQAGYVQDVLLKVWVSDYVKIHCDVIF